MIRSTSAVFCRRLALVAAVLVTGAFAQVTPLTGNAGGPGGPLDVLFVNGSNGGADRTVEVGLGQPITFDVLPAGTVTPGAMFAIWGFIGTPGPADVTTLPIGIGRDGVSALPARPGQSAAPRARRTPSGLDAPSWWLRPRRLGRSRPRSELATPLTVALQGVILDPAGVVGIAVTNAVILNVVDDRLQVLYSKIAGHRPRSCRAPRFGGNARRHRVPRLRAARRQP